MNEEREAETSERHPTKGRGVKAKMTRPNGRRHNRLACQSHVPSTRLLTPLVSSFFLHSFRAGGDWKETTSRERDEGTGASEEMTDGSQR